MGHGNSRTQQRVPTSPSHILCTLLPLLLLIRLLFRLACFAGFHCAVYDRPTVPAAGAADGAASGAVSGAVSGAAQAANGARPLQVRFAATKKANSSQHDHAEQHEQHSKSRNGGKHTHAMNGSARIRANGHSHPHHTTATAAAASFADLDSDEHGFNVYIAGLPKSFLKADIERLFGIYGSISGTIKLLVEPDTRVSRGIAFVRYSNYEDATAAIAAMHGTTPDGSTTPLTVKFANKKSPQNASSNVSSTAPYTGMHCVAPLLAMWHELTQALAMHAA